MKLLIRIFTIGAFLGLSGFIQAQTTHYVNADATCDGNLPCYTTIQQAVDAAQPNDKILVAAGIYTDRVTVDKKLSIEGAGAEISDIVLPDGSSVNSPWIKLEDNSTVTVWDIDIDAPKNNGKMAPGASPAY